MVQKIQEEIISQSLAYEPYKPSNSFKTPIILLWLKDNWLIAIGMFIVLTAIIWLIGYAVLNDWILEIPPVLISMASDIGIYIWEFFHLRKDLKQG